MPRRTAVTSSTPATAPPATSASSPASRNARSTVRQSQSQPPTQNALAQKRNDESPAANPHIMLPKKPLAHAPTLPLVPKKIIRPPKYHETHKFLQKESSVRSQLDVPSHLGHRLGECYRLAATMSRLVKQAALDTRPVSWGYGMKDGSLGHDTSEYYVDVLKRVATFRKDQLRHVSAGDKLSLFLTSAGRVLVCGRLFLHQDGIKMWRPQEVSFVPAVNVEKEDGSNSNVQTIHANVNETTKIVGVEAGHLAAYVIDDQGRILAWGTKRYGQLGLGDDDSSGKNVEENDNGERIPEEEQENEGDSETDETDQGPVIAQPLGRYDPVETSPRLVQSEAFEGMRITKVSAGNHFVLAMSSCGRAFSWGWNSHGQLGLGGHVPCQSVGSPRQIHSVMDAVIVVDIAAGHSHSLVIAVPRASQEDLQAAYASYSMVYAFGSGQHGCLGIGGEEDQLEPVEVIYFRGLQSTNVAAGHDHSLVVCTVGSSNYVYAFGGNAFGQLGIAQSAMQFSDMPMVIDELSGLTITGIGAGAYVSSALSGDGEVYTWGDGSYGKTARPDKRTTFVPWKLTRKADQSETSVSTLQKLNHRVVLDDDGFVTQLSMGAHHSIALYRTEGKPDRWRKFPMGPVVPFLDVQEGRETLAQSTVCESASAQVSIAAFGIALHCEACGIGLLCRVCSRRCHRGHRLVPRYIEQNVDNHPTCKADPIVCACGSRRPPPLRPRLHQLQSTLSNRPNKPLVSSVTDPTCAAVEDMLPETTLEVSTVYCAMASVPPPIPEDTVLRC